MALGAGRRLASAYCECLDGRWTAQAFSARKLRHFASLTLQLLALVLCTSLHITSNLSQRAKSFRLAESTEFADFVRLRALASNPRMPTPQQLAIGAGIAAVAGYMIIRHEQNKNALDKASDSFSKSRADVNRSMAGSSIDAMKEDAKSGYYGAKKEMQK